MFNVGLLGEPTLPFHPLQVAHIAIDNAAYYTFLNPLLLWAHHRPSYM